GANIRGQTPEIREEPGEPRLFTGSATVAFSDEIRTKTYVDGRKEEIYMIYLTFDCVSANREVKINEEFQDYAWVKPEDLVHYDLNVATRKPLVLKVLLKKSAHQFCPDDLKFSG
ncbi:nucleoside triphosphatase NudI, partial [Escherichia coli]